MPDSKPPLPKPRTVPFWKWPLLLLPSALLLATPVTYPLLRPFFTPSREIVDLRPEWVVLAIAFPLCFVLGHRLETWLRGDDRDFDRAMRFGCLILVGNALILAVWLRLFVFGK